MFAVIDLLNSLYQMDDNYESGSLSDTQVLLTKALHQLIILKRIKTKKKRKRSKPTVTEIMTEKHYGNSVIHKRS